MPTLGLKKVPAKVDTGADSSSIWCSEVEMIDGSLQCVFFGKGSPFYTGQKVMFNKKDTELALIENSFGHREVRYKVKIPMTLKGRTVKSTFTLADRSAKLYPILIGRSMLTNKFLVDVSRGAPMRKEEAVWQKSLQKEMRRIEKELNS